MTPKEKADSLIDRLESHPLLFQPLDQDDTIVLAKFVCDEMLEIHGSSLHQDFWKEVKKELESF